MNFAQAALTFFRQPNDLSCHLSGSLWLSDNTLVRRLFLNSVLGDAFKETRMINKEARFGGDILLRCGSLGGRQRVFSVVSNQIAAQRFLMEHFLHSKEKPVQRLPGLCVRPRSTKESRNDFLSPTSNFNQIPRFAMKTCFASSGRKA